MSNIQSLNLKCVESASDEYFNQFDYFCSITDNPLIFSAEFPTGFDKSLNNEFNEFFKNKLLVKSCDYGCDIYPGGVPQQIDGYGVYTFRPKVWNFISEMENTFNCKCNFYDNYNGFEFVFEFCKENKTGCYVFAAGNNGQEFTQTLYLDDYKLIRDTDIVKTITSIDSVVYSLLENNNLRFEKNKGVRPLGEQIKQAKESLYESLAEAARGSEKEYER